MDNCNIQKNVFHTLENVHGVGLCVFVRINLKSKMLSERIKAHNMHHYIIMQKFKTKGNNVIYLWTYVNIVKNLNIQENTHQVQAEGEGWSDSGCVGNTL